MNPLELFFLHILRFLLILGCWRWQSLSSTFSPWSSGLVKTEQWGAMAEVSWCMGRASTCSTGKEAHQDTDAHAIWWNNKSSTELLACGNCCWGTAPQRQHETLTDAKDALRGSHFEWLLTKKTSSRRSQSHVCHNALVDVRFAKSLMWAEVVCWMQRRIHCSTKKTSTRGGV